jgi:hypothetical protein
MTGSLNVSRNAAIVRRRAGSSSLGSHLSIVYPTPAVAANRCGVRRNPRCPSAPSYWLRIARPHLRTAYASSRTTAPCASARSLKAISSHIITANRMAHRSLRILNVSLKKRLQLGMPIGTASARLKKMILLELLQELQKDICHRCGDVIRIPEEVSIDHIAPWIDVRQTFFGTCEMSRSHTVGAIQSRGGQLPVANSAPAFTARLGHRGRRGAPATKLSSRLPISIGMLQSGRASRAFVRPAPAPSQRQGLRTL